LIYLSMSDAMPQLPLTQIVAGLPDDVPFVGPESLERRRGRPFRVRAGANESSSGMSPLARAAMMSALDEIHCYGDPEGYELRVALAEFHNVDIDEIAIGSGIDDILGVLVRSFIGAGVVAVSSLGGYPTFNYHVIGYGGDLKLVPYRDDHEDVEALVDVARSTHASLLYVANPDSPMGTWQRREVLDGLIAELPSGCVLLLDEAYAELAPPDVMPAVTADHPRVVRLRTFSKVYGMAGARVGYAIAHRQIVRTLEKVRNHFGVNRPAQAGALAALADQDFVTTVVRDVAEGRDEYTAAASELGLRPVDSAANFVAIDAGTADRARALFAGLLDRDVFVRMPAVAPLDCCLRLSVVGPDDRQIVIAALRSAVQELP
jgi:histidinol-phosphate aminotransferase